MGYSQNFEKYKEFLNKVVRYDFESFAIPKSAEVLDVGCGFGDRIRLLRQLGYQNLRGIDHDKDTVYVACASEPTITLGSIESTRLPDQSVDAIIVENVFHHIENYATAIAELALILRKNGVLSIVEPRNSNMRKLLDFITFKTPIPHILRGPFKLRYIVMGEEIATGLYPLWLRSEHEFPSLLENTSPSTGPAKPCGSP